MSAKKTYENPIVYSSIIVFLYIIAFAFTFKIILPLQHKLFNLSDTFAIVFIPHGIRVLSTCLLGGRAIAPLIIVHIITGMMFIDSTYLIFCLSILSAISVFIILPFYKIPLKKGMQLKNIKLNTIIQITFFSSFVNALLNSFTRTFLNSQFDSLVNINISLGYLIGDITGSILCFFIIAKIIKFTKTN